LLQHGIEFEILEKHSDTGGIWDPENAGSPMYESAHFISSKTTSGFYGLPMPDDYPDYPTYRQIRDYIRAFAVEFGLYDHIVFNAHVERTKLEDEGSWTVTVAGEAEPRRYRGLICANGTTWTPNLPTYPGLETFGGEVRHANIYRDPAELRGRRVLIVGAGNSGVDIACDAARNAESSFFSVRRARIPASSSTPWSATSRATGFRLPTMPRLPRTRS
jgi:cation diffusion facilitator CzcD-associated flavoprotein CzcO